MLMLNYITPVMYTDSTGYAPELIEKIKDAFYEQILKPIGDWLNTVPDFSGNGNNSLGLGSFFTDTSIGVLLSSLSKYMFKNISVYSDNIVYAGLSKVVGTMIGITFAGINVYYTLLADNGNTWGERLFKVSLDLWHFGSTYLVFSWVFASSLVGMPLYLAIGAVAIGSTLVYIGINEIYKHNGIE